MGVHLDPGADARQIALLLIGNVLAFLLGVAGETVLHATAVEVSGSAIAILGPPGSGKSTVAAQLCLAGAALVTEDTMRAEAAEGNAYCYRGPGQLRLRSGAAALAAQFPAAAREPALDGRITVRPRRSAVRRPRLGALLVPRISPDVPSVAVKSLTARERALPLLRNPRLIGWRRGRELRAQFETVTGVAAAVPVIEAQLPADQAMAPELGEELLERVATLQDPSAHSDSADGTP
jgi:hypothetical protein